MTLAGALAVWAPPAGRADTVPIPFTVTITPKEKGETQFSFLNESTEPVTGILVEKDSVSSGSVKFKDLKENCLSSGTVESPFYSSTNDIAGAVWEKYWGLPTSASFVDILLSLTGSATGTFADVSGDSPFFGALQQRSQMKGSGLLVQNLLDSVYYVQRMHTYVTIPEAGRYYFAFTTDDTGVMTYEKTAVASQASHPLTNHVYTLNSWSPINTLHDAGSLECEQGDVIYLAVWSIDTGGDDHIRVAWRSDDSGIVGPTYQTISSQYLSVQGGNGWPTLQTAPIGAQFTDASHTIRIRDISTLRWGATYGLTSTFESDKNAATELWNLPQNWTPTKVTLFGAYGNQGTLTLGSTESTALDRAYVFKTVDRPLKLSVQSVDAQGQLMTNVNRFAVEVVDPTLSNGDSGVLVSVTNPPSATYTHYYLRKGMQVKVTVPQGVYYNQNGAFMYEAGGDGTSQTNAYERYVPIGLSINNSAPTGDATEYAAEMQQDLTVKIRWEKQYALRVTHDFSRTVAPEILTGDVERPWATRLTSGAEGNPAPGATGVSWFTAGTEITPQIDASREVQADLLKVRYLPYAYVAEGAALGYRYSPSTSALVNDFPVGQNLAGRQQIDAFKMSTWGNITYRWKIQYGVQTGVSYTGDGGDAFTRIYQTAGAQEKLAAASAGTFWFDPGSAVKVLAQAGVGGVGTQGLTGWLPGDGYYFTLQGTVNPVTGAIPGGEQVKAPLSNEIVAHWLPSVSMEGREYRGMDIRNLLRPVTVSWQYGAWTLKDTVALGESLFEGDESWLAEAGVLALLQGEPAVLQDPTALVWDAAAKKLYPVKMPGQNPVKATWHGAGGDVDVEITVTWPAAAHYTHVAGAPAVELTPDPAGALIFREVTHTEGNGAVQNGSQFIATTVGRSVLRFGEIKKVGRSEPREYMKIRVVNTCSLADALSKTAGTALIGRAVSDPELDKAQLGTGHLVYTAGVRYNAGVYSGAKLAGLSAAAVYDLAKLRAVNPSKVILHPEALPGPVFAVNLHEGATAEQKITVVWYDDPTKTDGILWPYAGRQYVPRWPVTPDEGLGRIVIASEWGSESLGADGFDQTIAPAVGSLPAAATFDPSRFAELKVYAQADSAAAGYNPNEEHALIAPSLRYAAVSPRPNAVYALRAGDLNNYGGAKTSDPYVLVQFYDSVLAAYAMRVFTIVKEDTGLPGHGFAKQAMIVTNATGVAAATPVQLQAQPHKTMEAGEPVIAFYPLGVVEGAVPCPESTGENLKGQMTFWKDHKYSRWAVSGGTNAWFAVKAYYPLQPDFWWPTGLTGATLLNGVSVAPQVGASVAFLPPDLSAGKLTPTRILYKSDWPRIAPVLKAGETITYSGGEYRADHPTLVVPAADGAGTETIQTPGLPAVVAFAVGEVVFDALNPFAEEDKLLTDWTLRVAQVMDSRSVGLAAHVFPDELQPANGKTRSYKGKYYFNDLPASLQKRVRYDPITQQLELRGILNEKTTEDSTLTASPGAVYALEPNILTRQDAENMKAIVSGDQKDAWIAAVENLLKLSLNPEGTCKSSDYTYAVGLQPKVVRNEYGVAMTVNSNGFIQTRTDLQRIENARAFGSGLAAVPNGKFLDPGSAYPDVSWVTIAENNDPSMGGSPVALHIIKVDRRERYRGSIKVVTSDNVFDENVILKHTGDFGANADGLAYEWWYRPDDGALNVPPPYSVDPASAGDWKLFPDLSGQNGVGRNEVLLKGDPNAPETLLADSWWFVRYRHTNDVVSGNNWAVAQKDNSPKVNFEWAGAGNSDPFHDYDLNGVMDYRAQLSMGWVKRVLDAVNPYEARIADFTGEAPVTLSSMLQQLGPRYEGAVALNPDKDVIENVGLIELYQTILNRALDLSVNLSSPVSTPAIANAVQLASTRLSDFYTLLGNEAYTDAKDPSIGYGSASVEYGAAAPVVFAFQNQVASLLEEELDLLRGQDDGMARPVYNRLFWNFTKGEGEAAYVMNYNISDINKDGFIDEDDAMALYPQGHGDAWGHYLTALTKQYDLLRHPYFNWVSRSEFYNLMDIVMKVDFLDERKFAQVAAQKAKAGAEIVNDTYRQHYVEDETAQWQGYTDVNRDRAWGVQDWARRAGQGAYFDWITVNALLPSVHPNTTLEGIQKVDRQENADIAVISANLNQIQATLDNANKGLNPIGVSAQAVPFDINPYSWEDGLFGRTHFEQVYDRALAALANAKSAWDTANAAQNRLRAIANTEQEFRNDVYQQDIAYRNQLIEIFGRPYPGTVGSGKFYQDSYFGPDLAYYMYVEANSTAANKMPQPSTDAVKFDGSGALSGGTLLDMLNASVLLNGSENDGVNKIDIPEILNKVSWLYGTLADSKAPAAVKALDGLYDLNAIDFDDKNNESLAALNFTFPVTASTYSLLAPDEWGERPSVGELQQLVAGMLQLQCGISATIGNYEDMWLDMFRQINLLEIKRDVMEEIAKRNQDLYISKSVINSLVLLAKTFCEINEETGDQAQGTFQAATESIPQTLPTVGLAVSPGDLLAPARGALKLTSVAVSSGLGAAGVAAKLIEYANGVLWDVTEGGVEIVNADDERRMAYAEMIAGIDDMLDDEGDMRVSIFAESEQLRSLGEQFRSALSRGSMLIDEREAFNKRVAAMTQQNRYQDMTFRVERNHALQNYSRLLDIAARYVYLAAKAYDYETNLDKDDPGSPSELFNQIVRARTPGRLSDSGEPQLGDGLAGVLAHLKANYDVLRGQLGLINPQIETGKLSLRREKFRIFPRGYENASAASSAGWSGENDSDENWRQVLQNARVKDLWQVPEFRFLSRPFNNSVDAAGNPVAEPGIVLRFSTEIRSGKNVFGHPLSGGDHAYDPSVYANRIRSVGVWFSDYLSSDVLTDLAAAPRVYLLPTGADIMSIPNASSPDKVRVWNVVDQLIPVPVPGLDSKLPYSNFVPLLDSLDGRIGQQRRFSSFRAYHDSGDAVNTDELVSDSRLVGRSVWNTGWTLIIPGRALNADPDEGLSRFIQQVSDIKLVFETYGFSGN
jgi:hypothetical protein